MPGATQDGRVGRLATPLGKDKLLLTRFEGVEGLGELFEFRIDALSDDANIDFNPALGVNSSVHLDTTDDIGRDFSGVLTQARAVGKRGEYYAYSLVLRPWLWLLSLTSDCRIYANMTPRDIIKQVFENRGFSDFLDLTAHDYPTLEYTVQYRETDLNFVLRLMEEYGIYYYFQFMPGDGETPSIHYLVIADLTTHVSLPAPTMVAYQPAQAGVRSNVQQFTDWSSSASVVSGVFTLKDYDYENPGAKLLVSEKYPYKFKHSDLEMYNYPGGYDKEATGKTLADISRDVERTRNLRSSATGYAPSLTPGFTIQRTSLAGDQDPDNGDYLLLRCSHAYGYQTYKSQAAAESDGTYVGSYELAKSDLPYRMPLHTRKPVIAGTQSALVVGKTDEEIDVDEEGRICVEFYWDRKETASRRVRVAQQWAGGHKRGFIFIPRIGDEVLIQYMDGDPDRPVVVGSVYNGNNKFPIPMPDDKNWSGIRSDSTKGHSGHQSIAFNDTAGSELFYMRAQKDMTTDVLNNELRNIFSNMSENVAGNETITVGKPPPDPPEGAQAQSGGEFTLNATKKVTINVGPVGSPITQIVMDTTSITFNVLAGGQPMTQIVMDNKSITSNVGPSGQPTQIAMDQEGITQSSPMITLTGKASVSASAGVVKINS